MQTSLFSCHCTHDDSKDNLAAGKNKLFDVYLLSCEEEQDVALVALTHVDLDDGADGCLQVVPLRLRRVEDLHWMRASGDGQQRTLVEIHLELAGVERGAHDDDLKGNGERKTKFSQKHPPLAVCCAKVLN